MPLADFAKTNTTPTAGSGPTPPVKSGSLAAFAGKPSVPGTTTPDAKTSALLGPDAAYAPRNVDEARKLQSENPTLWGRISKQLMKPIGLVATTAEETGNAIGSAAVGDFAGAGKTLLHTPAKLGGILTGTRERSFTDVFTQNWEKAGMTMDEGQGKDFSTTKAFLNDFTPRILGLITDFTADPLNYVGGGLTKLGKVTNTVQNLRVVGDSVTEGSKVGKELKALGLWDDVAKLQMGATKAEQVQMGQRALLTFMANTRWETKIVGGARIYDFAAGVNSAVKQTRGAQIVAKIFSTRTSNQAFNAAKSHFDGLMEYRKGLAMDEAMAIQNDMGKLTKTEASRLLDLVEGAGGKPINAVDDTSRLARRLQDNFASLKTQEEGLGLLKTDIQDYFPHIKVMKSGEKLTSWQKFKSMFQTADGSTIDDATRAFGDAKTYSTKLASSKERTIEGTVNEINKQFGTNFFETNPAVAYAQRAMASAKAVTSKEFFNSVKQFGVRAADDIPAGLFSPKAKSDAIEQAAIQFESKYRNLPDVAAALRENAKSIAKATNETELFTAMKTAVEGKVKMTTKIEAELKQFAEFARKMDDFPVGKMGAEHAGWVTTNIKGLEGVHFAPDMAQQLEAYQKSIKPEELNVALRGFDQVQNWWKAQALVAPSYHVRNMAGNFWNNYLGGVLPKAYLDAGNVQMGKQINFVDDVGRKWTNDTLMKAAKESGVINEGWYAKDIHTALESEMGGVSWNPLRQNFALFRANRAVGSTLENNARLAHFIQRLQEGSTVDNAAMSVKKYLFDYGDLTWTEKNIFKRIVPFYTWTRKNIPLQLEKLITQPGKFAVIPKTTKAIESNVEQPNEKYLGDYIKNNVGVRVGADKQGNTMYFLLGNWLPAAQAIDFLSQPTENFIQSVSPFLKTPVELWANQSTFFEDTFGQPSKIERYNQENQSWLGFTMRKKTAYVLKNIRVLNELDKLNPGAIFGDKNTPSLANRIAPEMGFKLPLGIGAITTSEKRGGRFTPEGTTADRVLQSMFGKTTLYNPAYAKRFYLWDTQTKIEELTRAAKDAQRDGQKEYAKRLREELRRVKKERLSSSPPKEGE